MVIYTPPTNLVKFITANSIEELENKVNQFILWKKTVMAGRDLRYIGDKWVMAIWYEYVKPKIVIPNRR